MVAVHRRHRPLWCRRVRTAMVEHGRRRGRARIGDRSGVCGEPQRLVAVDCGAAGHAATDYGPLHPRRMDHAARSRRGWSTLLAGGVSNARDASILAVLDVDRSFGGAWPEAVADYQCACAPARPVKYFVFPRSVRTGWPAVSSCASRSRCTAMGRCSFAYRSAATSPPTPCTNSRRRSTCAAPRRVRGSVLGLAPAVGSHRGSRSPARSLRCGDAAAHDRRFPVFLSARSTRPGRCLRLPDFR